MLVRANTKSYTKLIAELVGQLRKSDRANAGNAIERYLAGQKSESGYWPDDAEIREEVAALLAYRRLGRGRLRMVFEAIEDHQRGWKNGKPGFGEARVARGAFAIEHVMPRKWLAHWPLHDGTEADRDLLIHTLGNLTLLTGKLNSKVSNGAWLGNGGKREGLEAHDVLMLNRDLLKKAGDEWSDEAIRVRTQELANVILDIWPVPANHKSEFSRDRPRLRRKVLLSDLIIGGVLQPGMTLFPRLKRYSDRVATLLADGRLEVDGAPYSRPSQAASVIAGKRTSGWWFFLTDQTSRRSLRIVRQEYISSMAVDAEDDDDEGDEDEA
jgi:hypothetical protein